MIYILNILLYKYMTKSECYYMYVKWNISVNLLLQVDCDDVSAYPLDLYGCQPVVIVNEVEIN